MNLIDPQISEARERPSNMVWRLCLIKPNVSLSRSAHEFIEISGLGVNNYSLGYQIARALCGRLAINPNRSKSRIFKPRNGPIIGEVSSPGNL